MKVILKKDVYKLGSLGDEVDVKPGYGRNYLIPQGIAVPLTRENKKQVEHHRALLAKRRQEAVAAAKTLAKKLNEAEIKFMMKAGESGKLFGSITNKNIHDALEEQGIELDKRLVNLTAPIKQLGTHNVIVKLHTEVNATLRIKVMADEVIKAEKPKEEEAPVEEAASDEE